MTIKILKLILFVQNNENANEICFCNGDHFSQYTNTYPIDVDESSWTGAGSAGRSKDNNFSAASLTADSSAVSTG